MLQVYFHRDWERESVRIGYRMRRVVPLHDVREALLAGSPNDEYFVLCHCNDRE